MIYARPDLSPHKWLSISVLICGLTCVLSLSAGRAHGQFLPPDLGGRLQLTPFFGALLLEDRSYDNAAYAGARIGTDISSSYWPAVGPLSRHLRSSQEQHGYRHQQ